MKKLIFSLTLLLIAIVSCNKTPSDTFVLQGTIKGSELPDTVYLSYYYSQDNEWYQKRDTARVVDSKFTFEGKLDGLTLAYLDFDNDYIKMFIEPSTMELHIDKDKPYMYELSGTQVDKENKELREETELYEKFKYEKFAVAYSLIDQINSTENASAKDSLKKIFYENSEERSVNGEKTSKVILNFASNHSTYQIAPALL